MKTLPGLASRKAQPQTLKGFPQQLSTRRSNVLHCRQLGVLKNVCPAVMMIRNVKMKFRNVLRESHAPNY